MSFVVFSLHPTPTIQQAEAKQTSQSLQVTKVVNQVAMKFFKILSIPYYLLAVPVQAIASVLIGAVTSGKSIKKTWLFGLTFFTRPLASAFGWEPKGGAPYTPRTKISEGLHVSRLPFKKDVAKIAKELNMDPPPEKSKIDVAQFEQTIERSSISKEMKTKLLDQLKKQLVTGDIQGVIIDVTEPEETTYVLGLGNPATKDDWNEKDILYFNLPAKDMEALDVQMNLDLAELAQIARSNHAGALVHCAKGIGRSLTIGLTAHALYGSKHDVSSAPAVSIAIKEIKSKRAYGLNASQELVAYESKLRRVLAHMSADAPHVSKQTIKEIENALREKSNLENIAEKISGNSPDNLILKTCLKELEEAKSKVSKISYIDIFKKYLYFFGMTP